MVFFYGNMWQAPWSGSSADLGKRIYSLNLTKHELDLPSRITLVMDITAAYSSVIPMGFEATEDNCIFLRCEPAKATHTLEIVASWVTSF